VRLLRANGHAPIVIDSGESPAAARNASVLISTVGQAHWLSVQQVGDRPRKVTPDAGFTPNPSHGGAEAVAFGDVHPDAYRLAECATSVPGGVGRVEMAVLAERALLRDVGATVPRWTYGGIQSGAQFAIGGELVGAEILATRAHLAALSRDHAGHPPSATRTSSPPAWRAPRPEIER
jgi:methylenetetrahydrofolate dehydrogenase (NADP+)/methenyltetrahydrofolate cyclohydrolase